MIITEEMIKELPLITEEDLKNKYYSSNDEIMEEARKEFHKIETMENQAFELTRHYAFSCTMGDWNVSCHDKTFQMHNKGIKLWARYDEGLKRVSFDLEKKTVAVTVENPTLPSNAPRIVDLSDAVDFFEAVRNNMEKILLTGTLVSTKNS